ncbi:MAG: helix-turn-helix domain-containing protein [Kosmotogaceae bacterium]|nr:helix-turn-helix domain-containing protein [Kosmotogaceae bacterium]
MVEMGGTKYYDTREVSKILDCTPWTIRKWINDGILKASKLGKRYFIDEWTIQKKLDWREKSGEGYSSKPNPTGNKRKRINEIGKSDWKAVNFEELPEGKYAILDEDGTRIGTLIREQD